MKYLFVFLFLLLLMPLAQHMAGMVKTKPLSGAIKEIDLPDFSMRKWFDNSFQNEFEAYSNAGFGFRSSFIRLHNQVDYTFYNKANANGVIIGKEEYLYEESYIKAYYGTDFIGKDSIDAVLQKVLFIQEALKKKNIDLMLVFNPGKASYYPEFIPDSFNVAKKITNHEYYAKRAKELNINLLDLKSYFIGKKKTSPYPLFSKCGIHWTNYCETQAEDTLMKFIGNLRKENVPELILDSIQIKKGNKFNDADIKEGMNLIFGPAYGMLAYPVYHIQDKGRVKINCITISDSFYWGIYGRADIAKLFNINQFWYYYMDLYNPEWGVMKHPSDIDLRYEIEKQQVIVIMATEATLPKLGWGFIQQAYSNYKRYPN